MWRLQRKPYSAITVQIDRLTAEAVDEDDLAGLFELLEIVGLQPAGPAEAARALRKKLSAVIPLFDEPRRRADGLTGAP